MRPASNAAGRHARLRLRPDWSAESVDYVRRVAEGGLCSSACAFYRVEPGFLLQGSLRAFLAPNNVTRKGPKIMERGEVGWAGGSAGPDFFIYLGAQPAEHWGHDHTVWAEARPPQVLTDCYCQNNMLDFLRVVKVADTASMAVAEKIVQLPPGPTKPGDMHILPEHVSLAATTAAAA